jgi:hypothetical protein
MSSKRRHNLIKALTIALGILAWQEAPAGPLQTAISVGLLPYSSVSTSNINAFNGLGYSAEVTVMAAPKVGGSLGFFSQGSAMGLLASGRYYLTGRSQASWLWEDTDKVRMSFRSWGLFADGGMTYYQIAKTSSKGGNLSSGVGLYGAAGIEYPVWQRYFVSVKGGIIYPLTVSGTVFSEVAIGCVF